ncbi:MAG: T9SS type A sorting domain-containing protein [Chlorobi bacterium]|nr:T9SS type A sorting domain-containing protein [Chlorobiota bacterium]MCI0715368.1 T9SS type A sorting domain-containing protein [Chlorobiota bacterium]
MKKTFRFFLLVLFGFIFTLNIFPQNYLSAVRNLYDGPNWIPPYDTGITCSPSPPGIIRDDGTYENGYRTVTNGDSTRFVHKMIMPSRPITLLAICVTWTALAPSGSLTYNLIIYDTTGPGGSPGNLITRIEGVSAPNIAIFPLHSRYRYNVIIAGLTERAYYIGVEWDNNPLLPFFISSDENGTSGGPGYKIPNTAGNFVWTSIVSEHPNFKNLGIRAEGQSLFPGIQYTYCRNGLNTPILDHSELKDSIFASVNVFCNVLDVNVRIDTVIHSWDGDLTFYLRKSNVGVKIINQVGGSGDNFIRTVLNDSASVPISSGTAPFTGSFRPSSLLQAFNGANAGGYWNLHITDTADGDTGFLKAWCVVLKTECPPLGITNTLEIPNSYRLYQNYPNPFNPSTKIKFGLPENANVKLVVYDVLGREAAVLVNEFKHANTYEIDFYGTNLSSGIYFYKLETEKFIAVRKMLLIK